MYCVILVNGVATVAGHVADKVAPHVKKHGSKLVPESLKGKDGQASNLDGAKFVAVSSLQGIFSPDGLMDFSWLAIKYCFSLLS